MTEQDFGTAWSIITLAYVWNPTVNTIVYEPITLFGNGPLSTVITIEPSTPLQVQLTSIDDREPPVTVTAGEPPRTVDRLIVSLQTSAISFTVASVFATGGSLGIVSTSSTSSTRNGGTPTSKPPRTTRTSRPNPTRNGRSKPDIGSGAIAGIAIGGIVILALIIGGWYFWRRKKRRTQAPTTTLTDDELARREGDGDKIVLGADQSAPTAGAYQTQYQEMSGNGLTQELDRSHSYKYAVGGAHELRAGEQPGELPYNGMEDHERANETGVIRTDNGDDGRNAETTPVPGANNATSQVSPHVEAQRKREVEWLEMEETRMRQRREALLQQGGGQHT